MKWLELSNLADLEKANELSKTQKVLLFKHSTRCSISAMALNRLEGKWKDTDSGHLVPFYLDLLNHRDISSQIASMYSVPHESPQALIIHHGECIYSATHSGIRYEDLLIK